MYKKKKNILKYLTIIYIFLTIIEFIKYLRTPSNIFGLVYVLISLVITFLLYTVCINYKKYYSGARISKLIVIVLLGFFASYILNYVVLNIIDFTDSSKIFISKVFVIKNIIKPIVYLGLLIFTFLEFKSQKVLKIKNNLKKY